MATALRSVEAPRPSALLPVILGALCLLGAWKSACRTLAPDSRAGEPVAATAGPAPSLPDIPVGPGVSDGTAPRDDALPAPDGRTPGRGPSDPSPGGKDRAHGMPGGLEPGMVARADGPGASQERPRADGSHARWAVQAIATPLSAQPIARRAFASAPGPSGFGLRPPVRFPGLSRAPPAA